MGVGVPSGDPMSEHNAAPDISTIATADDVDAAIVALYGDSLPRTGVSHVTAVWRPDAGPFITLEINDDTPRCATDYFILNLARARADAIITTGKILRLEPALSHDLDGPGAVPEALAAWRRERLHKKEAPWSVVLTSGRGLDLDHPLFHGTTRPLLYTTPETAQRLHSAAAAHNVTLMPDNHPSLRRAIEHLRTARRAALISIEAGPSTTHGLYEAPLCIDELLLSIYEGKDLPSSVIGDAFLTPASLSARFAVHHHGPRVETPRGPWTFHRHGR